MTNLKDVDLLRQAAKAVGDEIFEGTGGYGSDNMRNHFYILQDKIMYTPKEWNPLTDDGDALRLAVKLKLDVISDREDDCCSVWTYGNPDVNVKYGNDPYAATRRAIVRAAAAIGSKL